MKRSYKGCDLFCYRDLTLSGESMLFYSVMYQGFEVDSGFSCGEDKVKDFIKTLTNKVDDFIDNPLEYGYEGEL